MTISMNNITGLGTALVTPFDEDGKINWVALEWLINYQIQEGVDFLVPCGTTGESATLTEAEHVQVVRFTVEVVAKRVPVVAGTGSNSTRTAVYLTNQAKNSGADAVLVVSPYYTKPEPAGLYDYYKSIAQVGLPVILYDIPGRTGRGVPMEVIKALVNEKAIAGIKWASGDLGQLMEIRQNSPVNFRIFSGDDALILPAMSLGADGAISVTSHIMPKAIQQLIVSVKEGDFKNANQLHYLMLDLMRALFMETNPIPVKTALSIVFPEIFHCAFRSPMTQMSLVARDKLEKVIEKLKLPNEISVQSQQVNKGN